MMDKDSQTNNEDYFSKTKAKQDSVQDLKLDRVIQEQENQSRECQDKEQQNLHSSLDQVLVQHEDHAGDGQCSRCRPEPQQEEMIVHCVDDNPAGASGEESDFSDHHHSTHVQDQCLLQIEQSQDLDQKVDLDTDEELLILFQSFYRGFSRGKITLLFYKHMGVVYMTVFGGH